MTYLKLISRDITADTFRFYFYFEEAGAVVSPQFPNTNLAHEWYVKRLAESYTDEERRSALVDRRQTWGSRPFEQRTYGRRESDKEPQFEDRAKWTMNEINRLRAEAAHGTAAGR